MKSFIPGNNENICYLCGRWCAVTHSHHCLHGRNRKLAEQDGLKVNLCPDCHRKLHDKGFGDLYLEQIAEETWIKVNNSNVEGFIARYGKNYLEEVDK